MINNATNNPYFGEGASTYVLLYYGTLTKAEIIDLYFIFFNSAIILTYTLS